MCMHCARFISDESITSELKTMVATPCDHLFYNFNDGSIGALLLAYNGLNGKEAEKYAKKIIENYIKYKNKPENSSSKTPSVEFVNQTNITLKQAIDKVKAQGKTTKEEILHALNSSF
jgi:hypothetical protein